MQNLVEVRVRVSAQVFHEIQSELRGLLSEVDRVVLQVLPSKDVEISLAVPEDSNNTEMFKDILSLYRIALRYAATVEKVGAKKHKPSYLIETSRGHFE